MPQHLALICLTVRDYDEAIAFYVSTLGFTLLTDEDRGHEQPGKRWVTVCPPGAPPHGAAILLARATTPEQLASIGNQTGGRVFLFLRTDEFWRDYRAWTARGVVFVRPPREEPYGMVAVFEDLYGNRIDLIGPAA
jgi:catechol 2,3-dioxygenase-like lactoylglutathione lyase family enzyme